MRRIRITRRPHIIKYVFNIFVISTPQESRTASEFTYFYLLVSEGVKYPEEYHMYKRYPGLETNCTLSH
jgi:hypothetical protein